MTFQLDTSGTVPFAGGTLGVISWEGVGQRAGAFTQGYIEALLANGCEPVGRRAAYHPSVKTLAFADLAPETIARVIADCRAVLSRWSEITPTPEMGAEFWTRRQSGYLRPLGFPPLTVQLGDDGKVRFQ